ncbi:MAG: hypothetical protein QNL16_10775 [Rhodobacterales bacterium]
MATQFSNVYSRFIGWAKIILPLMGLAILSSLFLFSKSYVPQAGAELFDGNIEDFASTERITGPRFAGMSASGVAIQLSAAEAHPRADSAGAFDATVLVADVEFPNGEKLNIIAEYGYIDSGTMSAALAGGIELKTSNGYTAKTAGMTFALDRLDIRSIGSITSSGPLGEISAGEMVLALEKSETGDVTQGYVLMFKNGVKLVYSPK